MVKFRDIRNRRTDWRREGETEVLTFYFFFLKFILIASLLGRSRVLICSTGSQKACHSGMMPPYTELQWSIQELWKQSHNTQKKTPQQHEHRHPKQPLGCPTPVLLDELGIITIYIDCTDSKPCYFFLERENFKYSFKFLLYFFFFKWILQRKITAVAVSCGVSACVLDGYSSKWVSKLCMFIRDICWDQKNTEFRFRWVESIV